MADSGPSPDDLASIEEAIYQESVRTLGEQARVLEGLRLHAGSIVAAANVATAFLGGVAISRAAELSIASLAVICLFVAVVLLSLLVIAPRKSWVFTHHPHDLLAEYIDPGPQVTLAGFRRAITYHNGIHYETNSRQLRRLARLLIGASVCLGTEVVLLLSILVR